MADEEFILTGPESPGVTFNGSLGEYLLPKLKARDPNSIVHVNADTGASVTSAEFLTHVVSTAEGLKALGLQPQDVVAMLGRNSLEITAAVIGTVFAGGVFATLDPFLKTFELSHIFKYYSPKFIFCEPGSTEYVKKALEILKTSAKIILLNDSNEFQNGSYIRFKDMLRPTDPRGYCAAPASDPINDLCMIVCSSGTTGLPKGVGITHHNILFQAQGIERIGGFVGSRAGMSFLQTSHMFWISGLYFVIMSCMFNVTRFFITRMDEKNILKALRTCKPNWVMMPPAELSAMLKLEEYKPEDVSSLVMLAVGGSALTPALLKLAKERLPASVTLGHGYGMSELSGGATSPSPEAGFLSVGKVSPGYQMKVVDIHTGKSLGPNSTGELCFKSPSVMKGYVGNPESTKTAIDEQCWLHSGDLGYYNEDKFFYLTGRIKELIKYRTQQISPLEVESVLEKMEGVLEAGVVGIPHEADQHHAMALVVKQPASNITEQDVIQFVKDNMSEFKQLHGGVCFVDAIPRTATKKVKRLALNELALQLYKDRNV